MMMELRHIRYFLAVAEERHFTRAAAKVGIGQPPLSQQIRDLEAEVGAALFHRVAHGAELTEAGKVFLAGVEEMPLIAERATMAARRAARGETGSLRVGFTSTATFNVVVPSAIRTFRRAYPEIHLTLEEANTTRLITGLREGTLDVVFLRPGTSGTEELQLRRLSDDPIVVALPKRHPAAALEEIDLAILKDDPFLLFPREIAPTLYDTIVDACRKAGFRPVIGQVAPHITSIVNLVAAELGVSLVPAAMMQLRVTDCLPADCGAVANDPPCPRLPARRDVAGGARFRRPRRFVMLSGLCRRWVIRDRCRRSGQSGHVRYASKRRYFIGEAKRRYARLVSIAAAERPLFTRAVTPCLIAGELISSTVSIKARGHLRGPATVRSPGAPEKAQPVVVHSLP